MLHRNARVSAMLKKSNSLGDVEWDGVDASIVTMRKVSKSAQVAKGDTVVTSNNSYNYPSLVNIGVVTEVKPDQATSSNTLKLKLFTDFYSIQHAYIIENSRFEEQSTLANKKDPRAEQ
jgi:rod shape-determining protein MreC